VKEGGHRVIVTNNYSSGKKGKKNAKRRLRGGITAIECRHGSVYDVER
jgi:hypothetical protein